MVTLNFGSFPRSANHYTYEALRQAFGEDPLTTSLHSISGLMQSENAISTIRTPLECVPSWIIFSNNHRPDRADYVLEWYCSFYEACLSRDILFFSFEKIVSSVESCLHEVSTHYGIEQIAEPVLDLSTGFHLPTMDKSKYGKIISEMEHSSYFQSALSMYSEVLSRCV